MAETTSTNLGPTTMVPGLYKARVRNNAPVPVRCHCVFKTYTSIPGSATTAGTTGTAFEREDVERYLVPGEVCDFGERVSANIDPTSIRRHITRIYADDGTERRRRADIDEPELGVPEKDYVEFEIREDDDNLRIYKLM